MNNNPTTQNLSQLRNLGLPAFATIEGLASQMRLSQGLLQSLIYYPNYHYKVYKLKKKSGGYREIAQPSRAMKGAQSWILRKILDKLSSSVNSTGFEKGESILTNALPHIGAHVVLNLDIEDFFHSVSAKHVYNVFKSVGYSKKISHALTCLTTYNHYLPQGAPTSPKLANLTCQRLDARIQGYSGPKGIVYTRYADDITLSALNESRIRKAKPMIERIIANEGFTVNISKTQVSGTRKRKEVTGLVISEASVGVGRTRYRQLRAEIHKMISSEPEMLPYINGWLSYTKSVDKSTYLKLIKYIKKLQEKNKEMPIFSDITLLQRN
jgi:retron-type reverse transcriptase